MGTDWPNWVTHTTFCDIHGKKAFTKKAARAAIRQIHDKGMREYPCDYHLGLWHIGHLPQVIRDGRKTATDVFGPRP